MSETIAITGKSVKLFKGHYIVGSNCSFTRRTSPQKGSCGEFPNCRHGAVLSTRTAPRIHTLCRFCAKELQQIV
ncbi:MAG: hypothetical protein ACREYE_05930 [Gammaproteobacteria bacterium]